MKEKNLVIRLVVDGKNPRYCPNKPCKTCKDLICIKSQELLYK